jgi:excisionase family DNA binding protein
MCFRFGRVVKGAISFLQNILIRLTFAAICSGLLLPNKDKSNFILTIVAYRLHFDLSKEDIMDNELMTIDQTANMLGLSSRTIHRFIRKGLLPAVKIGGVWRIKKEDVMKLLSDNQAQGEIGQEWTEDATEFLRGGDSRISGRFRTCVIVDCDFHDMEEAEAVSQAVISLMNQPSEKRTDARCQYQFKSETNRARFTLWGNPAFVADLLAVIGEHERK